MTRRYRQVTVWLLPADVDYLDRMHLASTRSATMRSLIAARRRQSVATAAEHAWLDRPQVRQWLADQSVDQPVLFAEATA